MSQQPKDLRGHRFALWMIRELEIEQMVEELREMYPDLKLPELRRRATAQLDAITERPTREQSGGFHPGNRCTPVPFFRATVGKSVNQLDSHVDDAAHYLTPLPGGEGQGWAYTTVKPASVTGSPPLITVMSDKVRPRALFGWLAALARRIGGRR